MKHTKTRALALALVLALTLALPMGASAAAPTFTDVPSTHKNFTAIEFCVDNGFLVGRGGGIFDPDGSLTRGELATVWARTFHVRAHNFDDATKTHGEVDNAIVVLQGMGFFDGVSPTHFDIYGTVTREQVARLVLNTYLPGITSTTGLAAYSDAASISGWAKNAVSVCTDFGIFDNVVSGGLFKPQQPITRTELCQVIYNLMQVSIPTMYSISIDPSITGGSISADKSSAAAGDTVTLTITADPGMTLTPGSLTVNGTPIYSTTFTMPASNVVVSAMFQAIASPSPSPTIYTVTIDPSITGGTVTADKSTAAAGDTVTLTVTPDPGMEFVDNTLTVNGTVLSTVTFTMPAANVVVSAMFQPVV
ncbi:MAG: S-layer homology domain-containing protein [Firmicutes bacterium]|nr:S-layer homology domain-containing protein [Bacillota bacterium]